MPSFYREGIAVRRVTPRGLLVDEQVPGRGGARGERRVDVAIGIRERLKREAVADREEEGDDRLGVVAQLQHALALLRFQYLGDVGAGPFEELADLALDVRIAAAGAEQLVEDEE